MNKDFKSLQRLIQDLAVRSASLPSPRLSLDYGSRWSRSACVWEESFPSRSAAIRGAERAFSPVYSQAHQRLQDYMEPHAPNSLPAGAQMWLDHHLGEVRQALILLRTQRTAPVLNRMNALLVADQVLKEWSKTNVSLCQRYQLEPPGHYLSRAEFVSYDPSDGEDDLLGFWVRHSSDTGITCCLRSLRWRQIFAERPGITNRRFSRSRSDLCTGIFWSQCRH